MGGEQSRVVFNYDEVYWFVIWVLTSVAALASTIWAWLPDDVLNLFGVEYIPNRYWFVAWSNYFFFMWWTLTFLAHCSSLLMSHPRDSYFTMEDRHSRFLKP